MAWVGVRFSRGSNDRGGQAPALREKTPLFTVGRGPVPRQAPRRADSVGQEHLLLPVREQALPNYRTRHDASQ